MVHKDTDSQQMSSKMSENMTLLQTSGKQQQGEVLDDHLVAAVRERQEETRELLEGGLAAFMASKNSKGTDMCSTVLIKNLALVSSLVYVMLCHYYYLASLLKNVLINANVSCAFYTCIQTIY